jgi:predicted ArsR family transcriptional regulator
MKTSRQRILDYISQKRRVTSIEISRAFQMSPANARHHLAILEEQRLIESVDQKTSGFKGRPAHIYQPAFYLAGHNLEILSSALLENSQIGNERQKQDLAPLAELMVNKMGGSEPSPKEARPPVGGLASKLNRLTKRLIEFHYQARWEAHLGRPHLIFENCPYRPLIHEHPELCALDALIIELILQTSVVQTQKLTIDSSGNQVCRYLIGQQRV